MVGYNNNNNRHIYKAP